MLKLTEAELAEMGFRTRKTGFGAVVSFKDLEDGYIEYDPSYCGVWVGNYSGYPAEAYPQTKEDLLTLIRLFTPPQPPERLPDNHCYNCDGTGGDCAVDCKHCKGTGMVND